MPSRLAQELLSWSLVDVSNELRFLDALDVIPDEYDGDFHDPAAYHEAFLPHVFEELRACVANNLTRPLEDFPLGSVSSILQQSSALIIDQMQGPPLPDYLNRTIVIFVNASMATIYREGIRRLLHFFGVVRRRLSPLEVRGASSAVSNASAVYIEIELGHGTAQDAFVSGEAAKWTAMFLSTPLIVHERIHRALESRSRLSPVMMQSILTGQVHPRDFSEQERSGVSAVLASLDCRNR